ncbi:MAG: helix-turn-helix transcriptional regulator [Pseudomonadota bacterium]
MNETRLNLARRPALSAQQLRRTDLTQSLRSKPSPQHGAPAHRSLSQLQHLLSQPVLATNAFDSIKALAAFLEREFEVQLAFVSFRATTKPNTDAIFIYDAEGMTRALERARHYRTCPPIDVMISESGRPQSWYEATNTMPMDVDHFNSETAHAKTLLLIPFTQASYTTLVGLKISTSPQQPATDPASKDLTPNSLTSITAVCTQYLAAHFSEHAPRDLNRPRMLSPQEEKVMHHCALGLTDKETAIELGISPHTVRAHLNNAKEKLKARNKTHAAILYWIYAGLRKSTPTT